MPKYGQARVLTPTQQARLFEEIERHRHPEKNMAIMQISFKLGLRVQEIALLEIKEIAKLDAHGLSFQIHEIMSLPAAYTKGANATRKLKSQPTRSSVTFKIEEFNRIANQIWNLGNAGIDIDPENFYPPVVKRKGKTRDLPLVDQDLRNALSRYLFYRIAKDGALRPSSPLFLSQKKTPYSPDTLQRHMATMLRNWAGVEKASSHSGRRTVITDIIQRQGRSAKVAQSIAGHISGATTLIYAEPSEAEMKYALLEIGKMSE